MNIGDITSSYRLVPLIIDAREASYSGGSLFRKGIFSSKGYSHFFEKSKPLTINCLSIAIVF